MGLRSSDDTGQYYPGPTDEEVKKLRAELSRLRSALAKTEAERDAARSALEKVINSPGMRAVLEDMEVRIIEMSRLIKQYAESSTPENAGAIWRYGQELLKKKGT